MIKNIILLIFLFTSNLFFSQLAMAFTDDFQITKKNKKQNLKNNTIELKTSPAGKAFEGKNALPSDTYLLAWTTMHRNS